MENLQKTWKTHGNCVCFKKKTLVKDGERKHSGKPLQGPKIFFLHHAVCHLQVAYLLGMDLAEAPLLRNLHQTSWDIPGTGSWVVSIPSGMFREWTKLQFHRILMILVEGLAQGFTRVVRVGGLSIGPVLGSLFVDFGCHRKAFSVLLLKNREWPLGYQIEQAKKCERRRCQRKLRAAGRRPSHQWESRSSCAHGCGSKPIRSPFGVWEGTPYKSYSVYSRILGVLLGTRVLTQSQTCWSCCSAWHFGNPTTLMRGLGRCHCGCVHHGVATLRRVETCMESSTSPSQSSNNSSTSKCSLIWIWQSTLSYK